MSTDGTPPVPRTRAELRAAREAAAREAAAREAAARETAAGEGAAREAAAQEAAAREAAAGEGAGREAAARKGAGREGAGPDPAARAAEAREAQVRALNAERLAARLRSEERRADPSPADPSGGGTRSLSEETKRPVVPEPPVEGVSTRFARSTTESPESRSLSEERSDEPKRTVVPEVPAEGVSTRFGRSTTEGAEVTPERRRFLLALGAVLGILVLVGAGLAVVSLTQGPRLTDVQVDRSQAIESSGSRVIMTANQSLAAIDESQVTVEPAVPFTVDAAGRGVGIRFTVPLDDSTTYTVRVSDVTGVGGGPAADLTTSFTTPASSMFLLKRDAKGDDTIFRTELDGEGVAVYAHERINDFRTTSSKLVVSVEEDDGSKLLVMNRDGSDPRELPLPGDGYVGAIQVSERGGLVGYNYSDRELSETEGRASVLVTQSLSGDDEPQIIEVGGKEASIFAWQFVPDSAAVLFIDFDGALSLVDRSSDAGVQSLGLASNIQGVSRGTYTAIVERLDGTTVELNLADGSETPLEASDPDYGPATTITPYPGGTLRHVVARDEAGIPDGQAVIRVDEDGAASPLVEVGPTASILQACASPSGQYAAVVIAPDLAENPYDQMLLPLPQNLETHLLDLETGKELVALTGFDSSWCQTAPKF